MIVLTNDDGIDAPGMAALEAAVRDKDAVVVAPAGPMSECSHCVTTARPIRIHRLAERRFSVEGTPADCVRLASFNMSCRCCKCLRRKLFAFIRGSMRAAIWGRMCISLGRLRRCGRRHFMGLRGLHFRSTGGPIRLMRDGLLRVDGRRASSSSSVVNHWGPGSSGMLISRGSNRRGRRCRRLCFVNGLGGRFR